MITDEQGKKWLLQKLYDNGWRYLAEDYCGRVWLATEKPEFNKFGSLEFVGKRSTVTCIRDVKERRHFACFKNDKVHTWTHGKTFFSNYKYMTEEWDYAELVEL